MKSAFWHTLQQAFALLPSKMRQRFLRHGLGLFFVSLADFIGLAVLLPFLVALLHSGDANAYSFLQYFTSPSPLFFGMMLASALLFFVGKNYYAFRLQKHQISLLTEVIAYFSMQNAIRFLQMPYHQRVDSKSSLFSEKVYFVPLQVGQGVYGPLLALFQESAVLLLIFFALFFAYPWVSIALLGVALFSGALMAKWIKRRTLSLGMQNVSKRKKLFEEISLSLTAILDIRQSKVQDELVDKISLQIKEISKGELETNLLRILPFRVNEIIAVCGLLVLISISVFFTAQHDFKLMASVFALAMFRAIPAINRLQLQLVQLRLYASHIKDLSRDKETVMNDAKPIKQLAPLQKGIRLTSTGLKYGESPYFLFQNLNLIIPKGSITVLSGPSGSGKSTLLRLIAGQMPLSEGQIWIDSQILDDAVVEAWQHQTAFISQNPYLLQSSVADNIRFGSTDTLDETRAIEALIMAGLEEFAEGLYDKNIGEEGFKISEGQKQRLMLARAIYKRAQVFLLDEITANLDADNTAKILQTLLELKNNGHTIVFSSHNPEVFAIADTLCSFQNKQLIIHTKAMS